MGLLLALKALGNKELTKMVRLVENYKDITDCTVYATMDETGIYVYDTKNIEFLLYIQMDTIVLDNSILANVCDKAI